MKPDNEKKPDPQEIEKEISDFLTEKYGDQVKLVPPIVMPEIDESDDGRPNKKKSRAIRFDMKPEELIAYLDQYIIQQDQAKTILATKICTHFNRISHQSQWSGTDNIVGGVKNNVLMIGPTGVGKTYIIKLIAKKLGVPFIKGDATKFSETGYVGGDVDDLVRDLVREAGNDIELAEHGIIYIDEIDKIASSQYLMGADVSRTGVQRALLSLMEETEVEMKVPHDPVSIMQEVENFRKSGKREHRVVNTRNILFIMSGAFPALQDIIKKRISRQNIGFGADIADADQDPYQTLAQIKSEDLTTFGFEGEFVGRLPVRVIFNSLTEKDLFDILKNPSNPISLNKKIDFAAYGIDIRFNQEALYQLAKKAWQEKTGARGLVNAVENALIQFERRLPSTDITQLPVTHTTINQPEKALDRVLSTANRHILENEYAEIVKDEKRALKQHVTENCDMLAKKYDFPLNPERVDVLSEICLKTITDMEHAFEAVTGYYKEIKNIEPYFFNHHHLDIVFTDDAVCHIIRQYINDIYTNFETIYKELVHNFADGFQLLSEKAGKNSFSITQQALMFPDSWLNNLIKQEFNMQARKTPRPDDESLPE